MKTVSKQPESIDEYISGFPLDVQKKLKAIRRTIRKAAPGVTEAIKYRIPAFILKGNLIYFAAFKKHIGIYPAPRGDEAFREELDAYEGGKGTVQFPLDKPIPFDLIARIVKFRLDENLERARKKTKRKVSGR